MGEELGPDGVILVSRSGRGDKDMDTAAQCLRPMDFGLMDEES